MVFIGPKKTSSCTGPGAGKYSLAEVEERQRRSTPAKGAVIGGRRQSPLPSPAPGPTAYNVAAPTSAGPAARIVGRPPEPKLPVGPGPLSYETQHDPRLPQAPGWARCRKLTAGHGRHPLMPSFPVPFPCSFKFAARPQSPGPDSLAPGPADFDTLAALKSLHKASPAATLFGRPKSPQVSQSLSQVQKPLLNVSLYHNPLHLVVVH